MGAGFLGHDGPYFLVRSESAPAAIGGWRPGWLPHCSASTAGLRLDGYHEMGRRRSSAIQRVGAGATRMAPSSSIQLHRSGSAILRAVEVVAVEVFEFGEV